MTVEEIEYQGLKTYKLTPDEGKVLQRISDSHLYSDPIILGYITRLGTEVLEEPYLEQPSDYTEIASDYYDYVNKNDYREMQSALNTLASGNTSEFIDSVKEIKSFLSGYPDTDTLTALLAGKMDATQAFKTINGEEIKGEGNITIEGGGGSGDYIVTDDLSKVTAKEGIVTYVKKHTATAICNGVGLEGIDRTVLNYNSGASIRVVGNGINNTVYIEHGGWIYTTINSTNVIYYPTDWQEIVEGLFVKGSTTDSDDKEAKYYVVGTSAYTISVEEMDTDKYPDIKSVTLTDVSVEYDVAPSAYYYDGTEWTETEMPLQIELVNGETGADRKAKNNRFLALYNLGLKPQVTYKSGTELYHSVRWQVDGTSVYVTFMNGEYYGSLGWYNNESSNDINWTSLNKEIISTIAVNSDGEVYTDDGFDGAVDNFRRNPNGGRALIRLIDDATGYVALAHSVREYTEDDITYRSADFIVDEKIVRWIKNLNTATWSKEEYSLDTTALNNAIETIIGD